MKQTYKGNLPNGDEVHVTRAGETVFLHYVVASAPERTCSIELPVLTMSGITGWFARTQGETAAKNDEPAKPKLPLPRFTACCVLAVMEEVITGEQFNYCPGCGKRFDYFGRLPTKLLETLFSAAKQKEGGQ